MDKPERIHEPRRRPDRAGHRKRELKRLGVRTPYSITPPVELFGRPFIASSIAKAALGGSKRREHRRSQSGILLPIVPESPGDNADCNALSAPLPILPRRRLREWQSKASREGAHV